MKQKRNVSLPLIFIALITLIAGCKTGTDDGRVAGLTQTYPPEQPVTQAKLGVAFSGGGTRSMMASMGQMRALRDLGLLNKDNIGLISSVSGGTWAAAAYVFRGDEYINEAFLGTGVINPRKLLWDSVVDSPENLAYVPENYLGIVPTQTYIEDLFRSAIKLKKTYGYNWSEIWVRVVGERILEPFDLNPIDGAGRPSRYLGDKLAWVSNNVGLIPASEFQIIHDETAPPLIINGALFSNLKDQPHELIPFEFNGIKTGLSATITEDDFTFGGGFFNAYAFASTEPKTAQQDTSVKAKLLKTSLADAAGISSAFFATALANHIISTLKEDKWKIQMTADDLLSNFLVEWVSTQRDAWLEELEKETTFIPIYPYWSVASIQSGTAYDKNFYFADGGGLENTGIATLVSKDYRRILSFMNSNNPLEMETSEGTEVLSVKDNLAALFGYTPMLKLDGDNEKKYYRFSELSKSQFKQLDKTLKPYYNNQIFAADDFEALLDGLYQANADENDLGVRAATFTQTLTTVENEKFNIRGGEPVQVTWYYLTPASDWTNQLKDHVRQKLESEYSNFPNYDTVKDIGMEPQQINLLAHFTYWMVMGSGLK